MTNTTMRDEILDFYEERAAVFEFMQGAPRIIAERLAIRAVLDQYGVKACNLIVELKGKNYHEARDSRENEMPGVWESGG